MGDGNKTLILKVYPREGMEPHRPGHAAIPYKVDPRG